MANKIYELINKLKQCTSKKAQKKEKEMADFEAGKTYVRRRQRIEKNKIILPVFNSGIEAREYVRMHKGLGVKTLSDCSSQIKDRTIKSAFIEEVTKLEEATLPKPKQNKKGSVAQRAKMFGQNSEDSNVSVNNQEAEAGYNEPDVIGHHLCSMSSKEFSFKLLDCKKNKVNVDRLLNYELSAHELYLIKSGGNFTIPVLCKYLDCIDVRLAFVKRRTDRGTISLNRNVATFYSEEYDKKLYDIPVEGVFDLLKYTNENSLKIVFRNSKTGEPIKTESYPQKEALYIIRDINQSLLSAVDNAGITLPALAQTLHMSPKGIGYFLYGVVDYDYKTIDVILKHCGKVGIFCLKGIGKGHLEEQDGNLYIVSENDKPFLSPNYHLVFKDFHDKKISDVISVLIGKEFYKFFTANRKGGKVNEALKEGHVDNQGKRNFHEYDKHELEALVKWKRCGYNPSDYCDYCRSRGLKVSLYSTKDKRIIQLCDHCKDKIHPTNHYVKIIYTPNGGQNRRY